MLKRLSLLGAALAVALLRRLCLASTRPRGDVIRTLSSRFSNLGACARLADVGRSDDEEALAAEVGEEAGVGLVRLQARDGAAHAVRRHQHRQHLALDDAADARGDRTLLLRGRVEEVRVRAP